MYRKISYLLRPAIIGSGASYFIKLTHCDKAFEKAPDNVQMTGEEFNRITQGEIKVKFLSDNMTHHGFKYVEGLNVDTMEFSDDMCHNGLHFTSGTVLSDWKSFGSRVWRISIPDDTLVICYQNKCKAKKIILEEQLMRTRGDKHSLEFFRNLGISDKTFLSENLDFSRYTPDQLVDLLNSRVVQYIPHKYKTSEFYKAGLQKEYFEWDDIPAEHRTNRLYMLARYIAAKKKLFC